MEFNTTYSARKELSQNDFLRALLIRMANHKCTPDDICNITFGAVKESVKEVIICKAHVDCNYSVSVGYDRKEVYYENDVKLTRTVTDWKPHSGHLSGNAIGLAFNEKTAKGLSGAHEDHDWLQEVLPTIPNINLVEEENTKVSHEGLEAVTYLCQSSVESDIDYPGDRQKDKNVVSDIDIKELVCYRLPSYEVEYTYNEKRYKAFGFACGKPNAKFEIPKSDFDVYKMAAKQVKPLKTGMICSWVAFPVSFILAIIASVFSAAWVWAFVPVFLASAITFTVLHNKKYWGAVTDLQTANQARKLNALQSVLAQKGYSQLSKEELNLFN